MTIEEAKQATLKASAEYEKLVGAQTDYSDKIKAAKEKTIAANKVYKDLVRKSVVVENLLGSIPVRGRRPPVGMETNGASGKGKPGRKKKVTEE